MPNTICNEQGQSLFEYNGLTSDIWNCYKLQPINFPSPSRDYDLVNVPGKNGDMIFDKGRYNSVEIVIECFIVGDFLTYFDAMRGFLMADVAYHRLVDSVYPDEFRMACVRNVEAKQKTPGGGTVEITMTCMPQRFLKSGELPVSFTDSSKSQQTIYKYSGFSSYTKTNIIDPISAEIGMDLSDSLFYVIDMSGVTLADDEMIRVEGGFDKFFVALCSNNPVSSSSNSSAYRFDDTFLLHQYDPRAYWLFPAAANIKIYAEDTLVYESPNTEHETIHNQTMFGAKPIVKVDISDGDSITDYLFSIGPNGVLFTQPALYPFNEAQTITIDCEAMEAYSLPRDNPAGYKINWNPYVKFVKAPELMPGDNDIAYDATVSNLRIYPNWWRL